MADKKDVIGDALKAAGESLKVAGDKSLDRLAALGTDIVQQGSGSLITRVGEVLGNPKTLPVVAGEDLEDSAKALLGHAIEIYSNQAEEAIRRLTEIGVETAEKGTELLARMTSLGQQVATGAISVTTADRAMDNYLEALKLVGRQAENAAKVEAYKRAQAALATAKSVLFTGLQVALQVGQKLALAYIGAIV